MRSDEKRSDCHHDLTVEIDTPCESIASVSDCPATFDGEEMKRERLKNPSVLGPFQRLSEDNHYSSASRFLTW